MAEKAALIVWIIAMASFLIAAIGIAYTGQMDFSLVGIVGAIFLLCASLFLGIE